MNVMGYTIAVVCTMDTKGREAAFLQEKIETRGYSALLIDVSTTENPRCSANISNRHVSRQAGRELEELLRCGSREEMMATMGAGAALVLTEQWQRGALDGVIGIGGNQGTAIASTAMRGLPLGLPKFLVSTVASGNIRPFISYKDIPIVFSVGDLLGGPNVVTRSILANSVAAIVGMIEHGEPVRLTKNERTIAISALGNTELAVTHAIELLRRNGYEPIAFHASGPGGSAMEELIGNGLIRGVLDLTPHELTEEVVGVGAYMPVVPGRMTAAAKAGISLVVAPGSMEYLCFGPRATIPSAYQDRPTYMHNPYNANVKLSHDELEKVAWTLAERLNAASGKVALFVPARGWSVYGAQGGPFWDPEGYRRFEEVIERRLDPTVYRRVMDNMINDDAFVDACVAKLLEFLREQERVAGVSCAGTDGDP